MAEHIMIGLAAMIVLGVAAQWLSWRFNLPSILLLLAFGFLVGPVARLVYPDAAWVLDPDHMFGDLLLPLVSLSVALILYEGGLSLNFREITSVRGIVGSLVSVAIAITWLLAALAAKLFLVESWGVALLLGAVLVVSGPTVIIPMLRSLRPKGRLGAIIKWEGIVNDPLGALLAVLVFEVLLSTGAQEATSRMLFGVAFTVLGGGGMGVLAALLLAVLIRQHWVPDYLHNAVSIMFVVLVFAASNLIQPESGLFTVTVMGLTLANQRLASIRHIVEFKEHLRVMLIATLFILLAARLTVEDLQRLGWGSVAFVAAIILLVRPAAVFTASLGSRLDYRERTVLAWLAPRGIVAAAVSSVFGLQLETIPAYAQDAVLLGPVTFLVIITTVAVYGLTAGPLARRLRVADPNPQGLLIVGAHSWARSVAETLHRHGVAVLLADSNRSNVNTARMAGLRAWEGNVLADFVEDEMELQGIGRLIAITPNDEVNALAVRRFERLFGSKEVYQLPPTKGGRGKSGMSHEMHGRLLFDNNLHYGEFNERFARGAVIRATHLTEAFDYTTFRQRYGMSMVPLFIKRASGAVTVVTAGQEYKPRAGDTLLCLGPADEPEQEPAKADQGSETDEAAPQS